MPSQVVSALGAADRVPTPSGTAVGSRTPDEILARFYELMADAAARGAPYPAELAALMHELHHQASAVSGAPQQPPPPAERMRTRKGIPGW